MPAAGGNIAEQVKYHYEDQPPSVVNEAPPVQNTWYPGTDDEDVRHIWCVVYQKNDEAAAKDVEIRWTIDGNVYLKAFSLTDGTNTWIFKNREPSAAGTTGLATLNTSINAGGYADKRGQAYKTEIRMTGAPGTNQTLSMWDVYETLEET